MVLCAVRYWHSVWCYATMMCSTGIAYSAVRSARMVLCDDDVQYTPKSNTRNNTESGQFVPEMRFL
eukprot:1207679-Rhodomonas_salina.1